MIKTTKETITKDITKMMQVALLKSLLARNIINQPTYDKALKELMKLKEAA